MKNLQQLFAAIILTLLLSMSTLAGDGVIWPMKTDPPPPPPPAAATSNEAEADGTIHTGVAVDPVTEVLLSVLPSVLALF